MGEMDKRRAGLTNSQIAELVWNLDDQDFYEVFILLHEKIKMDMTIGQFIDVVMEELKDIREET